MPTSHRYFRRVVISSSSSLRVLVSASDRAAPGAGAGSSWCEHKSSPAPASSAASFTRRESKNTLSLSSGISIMSCRHRPGRLSSCARVHFTPWGKKRLAGAITVSAWALVPMRQSRLSVFKRAPPQVPQGV